VNAITPTATPTGVRLWPRLNTHPYDAGVNVSDEAMAHPQITANATRSPSS